MDEALCTVDCADGGCRPVRPHFSAAEMSAGMGAACVSAVVVNPFDVVKTRQQAAVASLCISGCPRTVDPRALHGLECHVYDSSLDAARRMVRRNGLRALWRGTGVSLAHAAPSVGLYLPTYDYLQARYAELGSPLLAPALAGATARALVTLVVAPVELVRTRVQAGQAGDGRPQGLLTGLAAALGGAPSGSPRWQVLWRGAGATLARDVPFSALYWAALEPLRRALVKLEGAESGDTLAVTRANVVAGSTAGALAAALTTPLDALKTLRQGTLSLLRTLNSRGQLFVGVLPRTLRAAPACGIVLAAYEVLKLQ